MQQRANDKKNVKDQTVWILPSIWVSFSWERIKRLFTLSLVIASGQNLTKNTYPNFTRAHRDILIMFTRFRDRNTLSLLIASGQNLTKNSNPNFTRAHREICIMFTKFRYRTTISLVIASGQNFTKNANPNFRRAHREMFTRFIDRNYTQKVSPLSVTHFKYVLNRYWWHIEGAYNFNKNYTCIGFQELPDSSC